MEIKRLINDLGQFRCFEVDNKIISRRGMAQVISQLDGVSLLHEPRFYDNELFCEFKINGHKFEIREPWGDSTTYDVVAPFGDMEEMELVARHFEKSTPIKGGDSGHAVFFFINWFIGALVIMGIIYLIWKGGKWLFS